MANCSFTGWCISAPFRKTVRLFKTLLERNRYEFIGLDTPFLSMVWTLGLYQRAGHEHTVVERMYFSARIPQARRPTLLERGAAGLKELVGGGVVNRVRWLVRSYPLWLSRDFLRALPGTWRSYHKVAIDGPIDVSGGA